MVTEEGLSNVFSFPNMILVRKQRVVEFPETVTMDVIFVF